MRDKRSAPWWIWLVIIAIPIGAISQCAQGDRKQDQQINQTKTIVEPVKENNPIETETFSWIYSQGNDSMSSGIIKEASIKSSNTFQFDFPYQGEQRATLVLRKHPRYGNDVILSIEKGQFMAGVTGKIVHVRFDDNTPIKITAFGPDDHDSKILFLQGYKKIVERLKSTSKLRIESTVYNEGSRVFEFDVAGLNF